MDITIRKARYKDTKQVQFISKESWHATYKGIIPLEVQDNFLKSAYNDDQMKLRLERSILYVAEVEDEVVGFANYSYVQKGGKVELGAIYLLPEFQGKGIGSALLQQAIDELEDVKEIYINVERDNKIGRTFYEAKGFEIVKEFEDELYGHILKTVRMVKKIR